MGPAVFIYQLTYSLQRGYSFDMELTTAEFAKRLGVAASRVRQLVLDGRIKARRPNPRLLLIDERELAKVKNRKPGRPLGKGKQVRK